MQHPAAAFLQDACWRRPHAQHACVRAVSEPCCGRPIKHMQLCCAVRAGAYLEWQCASILSTASVAAAAAASGSM